MHSDNSPKKVFFGLYNQTQTRLYSYILAMVHSKTDAEDIMQETAIVLWDKFEQYQEGTNFGAWAVNIARNKVLEFMRSNKRTKKFFKNDFYESVSKLASEDVTDDSDQIEALQFCLKKIPDNSRKLLSLRYKKEIPLKRIAQLSGRSANGLYQSFSRLISALRDCMNRYTVRRTV